MCIGLLKLKGNRHCEQNLIFSFENSIRSVCQIKAKINRFITYSTQAQKFEISMKKGFIGHP